MKKIILITILGFWALLSVVLFRDGESCGSPCDLHTFLNPFGLGDGPGACITMCVYNPNPLFYPVVDLLIITLVGVFVYWLIKKRS